jgi:hypothetical protein
VIRPGSRSAGATRWLAFLAVGALLIAGCGAFRREPLDVPPGHRVVLGEIFINGFSTPHLVLDLAREDGGFQEQLPVDAIRSQFVITLPPGHYRFEAMVRVANIEGDGDQSGEGAGLGQRAANRSRV